jgi:ribosomal protein S18 acetylase RimI-like enzyme
MAGLSDEQLADRCAQASPAVSRLGASSKGRTVASLCGTHVHAWPAPHPWATRADLTAGVQDAATLDVVLGWLAEHGSHGWTVLVRERDVGHSQLVAAGLAPWSREPVFALPSADAAALRAEPPEGVAVGPAADRAEFVAGYGAWMADLDLAEQLVAADDVGHPAWSHLVARHEGRPVGAAMVRFADGTGYVSALGVTAGLRGRGVGAALAVAAARVAAAGTTVTWLHATDEGARLYSAVGFRQVDVHVLLAPAGTPPEQ